VRAEPLPQTRVYRFYSGGALLERFRGGAGEDSDHPEDWVGSVTDARNPGREVPGEGLTRLEDGRLLREVIEADRAGWLGGGVESTGVLIKLLDSAERLPVHAHPDRAFAGRHLGSAYGKTEAWIVLATRDAAAEVWIGQRESVDARTYRQWIDGQDTGALLESLNRVPVGPGDVIFVPAGVPHAIGAGVLLAELQEPTDFSIVCEWSGFPIEPADSHLGLGWDTAIEALDLDRHAPVRSLPEEAKEFFWADERAEPAGRFAVWMVLEGDGTIDGRPARAGDCFAVPAALESIEVAGELRVLRCLGPERR
jgi:mannose-6-phosphate isomerase